MPYSYNKVERYFMRYVRKAAGEVVVKLTPQIEEMLMNDPEIRKLIIRATAAYLGRTFYEPIDPDDKEWYDAEAIVTRKVINALNEGTSVVF